MTDNQAPYRESQHIATPGGMFYPEMGERHDGSALFIRRISRRGYYLTWTDSRHAEALAAFKSLRITPRHMDAFESCITGIALHSAGVTWAAGKKLRALCVHEALLD